MDAFLLGFIPVIREFGREVLKEKSRGKTKHGNQLKTMWLRKDNIEIMDDEIEKKPTHWNFHFFCKHWSRIMYTFPTMSVKESCILTQKNIFMSLTVFFLGQKTSFDVHRTKFSW